MNISISTKEVNVNVNTVAKAIVNKIAKFGRLSDNLAEDFLNNKLGPVKDFAVEGEIIDGIIAAGEASNEREACKIIETTKSEYHTAFTAV